jgi:hypothetical protein
MRITKTKYGIEISTAMGELFVRKDLPPVDYVIKFPIGKDYTIESGEVAVLDMKGRKFFDNARMQGGQITVKKDAELYLTNHLIDIKEARAIAILSLWHSMQILGPILDEVEGIHNLEQND